jgi:hypothetical protein
MNDHDCSFCNPLKLNIHCNPHQAGESRFSIILGRSLVRITEGTLSSLIIFVGFLSLTRQFPGWYNFRFTAVSSKSRLIYDVPDGYKYGDLALQVGGVSVNETVSSAGLRPKSDCSGKAQKQLYGKLQTRPLVREGATKQ